MRIRNIKYLISTILSILIFQTSEAAVDETWGSGRIFGSQDFNSGLELKKLKKLGVGFTAAGANGLFGTHLAINFTQSFSVLAGFGVSRGFNSANLQLKQSLKGRLIIPYVVGGYSHWYSKSENEELGKTSPAFFRNKFLNSTERRTSDFAENILYPGIGLDFLNYKGDWSGVGFFAEVLYMVDIDDLVAAPTAGIGTVIYF